MLAPESNGEGNDLPAMAVLAIRPVTSNAVETAARPVSGGPPGNWRCVGRGDAWVVYIRPPWQGDCPDGCRRRRLCYSTSPLSAGCPASPHRGRGPGRSRSAPTRRGAGPGGGRPGGAAGGLAGRVPPRGPTQLLFRLADVFFGQVRVVEYGPHVVSLRQQLLDPAAGGSMRHRPSGQYCGRRAEQAGSCRPLAGWRFLAAVAGDLGGEPGAGGDAELGEDVHQ